jgi:hypothetical protein
MLKSYHTVVWFHLFRVEFKPGRGNVWDRATNPGCLTGPLHYISCRSDFGFEFAEIFVIEKRLAPTRRVGESATSRLTEWVGESLTPRLGESESRRPPDWPSRGVAIWNFFKSTRYSSSVVCINKLCEDEVCIGLLFFQAKYLPYDGKVLAKISDSFFQHSGLSFDKFSKWKIAKKNIFFQKLSAF